MVAWVVIARKRFTTVYKGWLCLIHEWFLCGIAALLHWEIHCHMLSREQYQQYRVPSLNAYWMFVGSKRLCYTYYTSRMNRHNDDCLGGSSCLQCPTVYDHTDDIFLQQSNLCYCGSVMVLLYVAIQDTQWFVCFITNVASTVVGSTFLSHMMLFDVNVE